MQSSLKFASKWKLGAYTLLAMISAFGNVVIAYVTKIMLNAAQYRQGNSTNLIKIAGIGAATILIIMLSNFVYRYIKCAIIQDVNVYLKEKTMSYLIEQRSDSQKDGLSLMTNDLKQIETSKTTNELMIIAELVSFLLSVVVGLINSWILTLIFMVTTLIPGLVQRAFTKTIQAKAKVWETNNVSYTQSVNDGLNGAQTVGLYDAQSSTIVKVVNSAKRMEEALKNLNFTQAAAEEVIMAFAEIFSFILPFLVGAILMLQGQIGVGTLIMIVQLSNEFINPIVNIFEQLNAIKSTKPMWDKVEQALSFSTSKVKSTKVGQFTGLKVEDASYSQGGKAIFTHLNLTVAPNEKILLMAPSGWGKTTLLNLMLGKIKPNAGHVFIDDEDVTGNWAAAHDNFSYVNQKPFIFDDTIKFNILLGRKVSPESLAEAVESAGLTELVNEKGWDYQVGEKGANLSGGQIQRIEIARAFLSERPVLLADEATSALDPELSLAIHKTLLKKPNLAVIEVAHKISATEKSLFDRIINLNGENGE